MGKTVVLMHPGAGWY